MLENLNFAFWPVAQKTQLIDLTNVAWEDVKYFGL